MKFKLLTFVIAVLLLGCSSSDNGADNGNGGNNISLPTVTISQITNITENSATSGGNVTNDGGASVTSRGICWSTSQNPTINDDKTNNGNGEGSFNSLMISLNHSATYYVRAYATNSQGTNYSSQLAFTTNSQQNVFEGSIILNSQQEVSEFGANQYIGITGFLKIIQNDPLDPIVDISSLETLTFVGGLLEVKFCESLTDLQGLENINAVGGLSILDNNSLSSLEHLSSLTTSGDHSFTFLHNDLLTNFSGLDNLETINSTVFIAENDALESCQGLTGLNSVGGGFFLERNDNLTSLDGLSNLSSIEAALFIIDNPNLTSIEALSSLVNVYGISIYNTLISSLESLSGINSNQEFLDVGICPNLVNLNGLESISTIDRYVNIVAIDQLENLEGLNNLISVNEDFHIQHNSNLINLDGIDNLTNVRSVDIQNNESLLNMNTLNGVEIMSGSITVKNNPLLSTLAEFTINGSIHSIDIDENSSLLNIDGLQEITEIVGYARINENSSLTNLNGLQGLTSFGSGTNSSFHIWDNDQISTLEGLHNLLSLNADMTIYSNDLLIDFCALETLFNNNGLDGSFEAGFNAFNPTQQDIIDGNCSD